MNKRYLYLCGMITPVLFIFTAVLGGILRPGYSHISETVSELFSPGSPDKILLDTIHTTFVFLLILFGIGILQFVRVQGRSPRIGIAGAGLYILMGLVSVLTAAVYHQDPWGTLPTLPGQMHIILSGVSGFISMLSFLLIGIWFLRYKISPWFGTYTWVTVILVWFSTGNFLPTWVPPSWGWQKGLPSWSGSSGRLPWH
jgi:hypothetical protein